MFIHYLVQFFKILNHPLNKKQRFKAIGRLLWWKINQLYFHLPAIVALHNSKIKFICHPQSSYGSLIMYCNLPEYREMTFLKKILKQGSIFVDIGANVGAYTILAASVIKTGKIFSFEPMPSALDILYENVKINNLEDRVKIVEKVVSDKTGYERFVGYNISEYSHIAIDKTSKSKKIPSVKLDDFCKDYKIDFIDAIKIDVEGAELKVLKGLEYYLSLNKVGLLILELNKRNILFESESNQAIDYLEKFKYTFYIIDDKLKLEKVNTVDPKQTLNVIVLSNAMKNLIGV